MLNKTNSGKSVTSYNNKRGFSGISEWDPKSKSWVRTENDYKYETIEKKRIMERESNNLLSKDSEQVVKDWFNDEDLLIKGI